MAGAPQQDKYMKNRMMKFYSLETIDNCTNRVSHASSEQPPQPVA
jgi:hypothetical protein